jgi:hypothetical protein
MIEGTVVVTEDGRVGTIVSKSGKSIMVLLSDGFIWHGNESLVYEQQEETEESGNSEYHEGNSQ